MRLQMAAAATAAMDMAAAATAEMAVPATNRAVVGPPWVLGCRGIAMAASKEGGNPTACLPWGTLTLPGPGQW